MTTTGSKEELRNHQRLQWFHQELKTAFLGLISTRLCSEPANLEKDVTSGRRLASLAALEVAEVLRQKQSEPKDA